MSDTSPHLTLANEESHLGKLAIFYFGCGVVSTILFSGFMSIFHLSVIFRILLWPIFLVFHFVSWAIGMVVTVGLFAGLFYLAYRLTPGLRRFIDKKIEGLKG